MTTLVALMDADDQSKADKTDKEKKKAAIEEQAGMEIRDAAMSGHIPRETLTDVAQLDSSSVR